MGAREREQSGIDRRNLLAERDGYPCATLWLLLLVPLFPFDFASKYSFLYDFIRKIWLFAKKSVSLHPKGCIEILSALIVGVISDCIKSVY